MKNTLKPIYTLMTEQPIYLFAAVGIAIGVLAFVILGIDFLLWNGKVDVEVMDIVKIISKG
jgi:hypothetical protein